MKKNENILKYIENYKKKYDINYFNENTTKFKVLNVLTSISWIYSFFFMAFSILSFSANFKHGVLNFSDFKRVYISTIICSVVMVIAAAFYVCKKRIIGLIAAVVTQPFVVLMYKPMNVYGMGYKARYYFSYLVPAILVVLFAGILLFCLIRAIIKNNRLYDQIIAELYKQHGTKNGEKLSEEEWQGFLNNYDPHKVK